MNTIHVVDGQAHLGAHLVINLRSYTQSQGFVGWRRSASRDHRDTAAQITKSLRQLGESLQVVSSLAWLTDTETTPESQTDLLTLIESRWVKAITPQQWDESAAMKHMDPLDDTFREQFSEFVFGSIESKIGSRTFLPSASSLLRILSREALVFGHLFLWWPQREIAVYFHDLGGIGAIASNNGKPAAETALKSTGIQSSIT